MKLFGVAVIATSSKKILQETFDRVLVERGSFSPQEVCLYVSKLLHLLLLKCEFRDQDWTCCAEQQKLEQFKYF